jgi:hypothetical protein
MATVTNTMSAAQLIQCLAGDLLADPGLLLETIKEEEDLLRVARSYFAGDLSYDDVLDTVKDFI